MKSKKITFFLIIISNIALFFLLNECKRIYLNYKKNSGILATPVASPIGQQKPFVILTMSYNNSQYCKKNVESLLNQDYDNYRIVYIDDASTDETYDEVASLLSKSPHKAKVNLVSNPARKGAMENLYRAVSACKDEEIVIIVDGDDWLAHDYVLSYLNSVYANDDVWMTYGNYLGYPEYRRDVSKPIKKSLLKNGEVRAVPFRASHLRTFYAGLFKKIPLSEFVYEGHYFDVACDVASMIPMLELAREHAYFIPEILYIYNLDNPLNDEKIKLRRQIFVTNYIKNLSKFDKLDQAPWENRDSSDQVDMIVFSYNRPMQLYAFLESFQINVKNLQETFVLYRADDEAYERGYKDVKEAFPKVRFIKQSAEKKDFKPLLLKTLYFPEFSRSKYVIFAVDDLIVKEPFDLSKCAKAMETHKAYGFYLRLGKEICYSYMQKAEQELPPFFEFQEETLGWQFSSGSIDWDYPNSLDLTLFDKNKIKRDLTRLRYKNPNELEHLWSEVANHQEIGLCFNTSKAIGVPLNIVSTYNNVNLNRFGVKELLEKWLSGQKIDIAPVREISHDSTHVDFTPSFISRNDH